MKLFFFRTKNNKNNTQKPTIDSFLEISIIMKEARIKNNLSIEDLAKKTLIPISTLRSIENNDKNLIPEYPFIRSILIKIEDSLLLEKFELTKLVSKEILPFKSKRKQNYLISKLDLINTWHGGISYLLILLISLFVLNRYYSNSKVIEFKYIDKNSTQ